ncbi:DnaD domain protein [uncultured Ruthenibacterium sp.]|uniref:DnaD domain protein n=1 Tax=uncultured Ruthenibacterium sp. TaxID=1905347 RepID=UPI00349E782C
MAYRLCKNLGDSIRVPQLVISKLPQLEDDWLRVALMVISTGETDPARLAHSLRLKSPEKAREALLFWKGAGLLESCDDSGSSTGDLANASKVRSHMTTPEVTAAARNDPAIAALVQESQRLMGGVITQSDTNILVSLYVADGLPVDFILLGVAHFVSLGKRSARYIERALLGWQAEGIDTLEAAERHLKLLTLRSEREAEVARLFHLTDSKFTKAEQRLIASWYEEFSYDESMISEAIAYAGEKQSVRYVNGILRTWYSKGYRTVRDVIKDGALTTQNIQPTNPSAKSVLGKGPRRAPVFKQTGGK